MKKDLTWAREPELPRREAALGLAYLPFHVLAMPQLLEALATAHPGLTAGMSNAILYGIGTLFIALAFGKRLFAHYCIWVDNAGRVLLTLGKSFVIYFGAAALLALLLPVLQVENIVNPNDETLLSLTGTDFRITHALAIFIAPIVEEVLFRGVVFGALRPKYPVGAYIATCLLFAGAHLWRFIGVDTQLYLYVLQYLPVCIALCYAYEKSGCLWTPILFHMMNNMMAYNMMH